MIKAWTMVEGSMKYKESMNYFFRKIFEVVLTAKSATSTKCWFRSLIHPGLVPDRLERFIYKRSSNKLSLFTT